MKITALMFLLPFSESYKLIRKNPNMLELIVVILYQEFFRLKTLSNKVDPSTAKVDPRLRNDILEQI